MGHLWANDSSAFCSDRLRGDSDVDPSPKPLTIFRDIIDFLSPLRYGKASHHTALLWRQNEAQGVEGVGGAGKAVLVQ